MNHDITLSCRNCEATNGLSINQVFEETSFACHACSSYALPKEVLKGGIIWGAFSVFWVLSYFSLEYVWYKKTSSEFQVAMKEIGDRAVYSAKKQSPEFYTFNPFKFGSYSAIEKQTDREAQEKILLSVKSPKLYAEWVQQIKKESKFYFWKSGFMYPTIIIIIFLIINYRKYRLFPWDILEKVGGKYESWVVGLIFFNLLHIMCGVGSFVYWVLYLELPFLVFN